MKRKFSGIYSKVFFYTLAILLFTICVTAMFFANQIGPVIERAQQEQLANVFAPLVDELRGKTDEEAANIAKSFYAKNTAFAFSLSSIDGEIVYQSDNFEPAELNNGILNTEGILSQSNQSNIPQTQYKFSSNNSSDGTLRLVMITDNGGKLYITGQLSGTEIYVEYIEKTAIALGIILLVSIIGAALFARWIASPIRKIAKDTKNMAELQTVPAPKKRNDEIGELAVDVYSMYEALKSTIAQLETEITRQREMEENQRYFFSAASHELKTPIAAMSALVEEMLDGMVNIEEHPESLRKCMKMIAEQKKLVSEILEIVRLSGSTVAESPQNIRLHKASEAILSIIKPLAEIKNIELHTQIPEDCSCRTDRKMLERVLSNVFTNAVQNTPENGIIRIWTENKGDDILFSISNTGEQIDKEILPKLFEPFFRADQARSRSSGHSGLGLTIVKRILDHLEIPFALENTDAGVVFWMRLPK